MVTVKGKTWRIVSTTPYKTENVATDLFLLGVFTGNGKLLDYVRSGRPSTYRVYESIKECQNGINALKRNYSGCTLKPVQLLTGEIVEQDGE